MSLLALLILAALAGCGADDPASPAVTTSQAGSPELTIAGEGEQVTLLGSGEREAGTRLEIVARVRGRRGCFEFFAQAPEAQPTGAAQCLPPKRLVLAERELTYFGGAGNLYFGFVGAEIDGVAVDYVGTSDSGSVDAIIGRPPAKLAEKLGVAAGTAGFVAELPEGVVDASLEHEGFDVVFVPLVDGEELEPLGPDEAGGVAVLR